MVKYTGDKAERFEIRLNPEMKAELKALGHGVASEKIHNLLKQELENKKSDNEGLRTCYFCKEIHHSIGDFNTLKYNIEDPPEFIKDNLRPIEIIVCLKCYEELICSNPKEYIKKLPPSDKYEGDWEATKMFVKSIYMFFIEEWKKELLPENEFKGSGLITLFDLYHSININEPRQIKILSAMLKQYPHYYKAINGIFYIEQDKFELFTLHYNAILKELHGKNG